MSGWERIGKGAEGKGGATGGREGEKGAALSCIGQGVSKHHWHACGQPDRRQALQEEGKETAGRQTRALWHASTRSSWQSNRLVGKQTIARARARPHLGARTDRPLGPPPPPPLPTVLVEAQTVGFGAELVDALTHAGHLYKRTCRLAYTNQRSPAI